MAVKDFALCDVCDENVVGEYTGEILPRDDVVTATDRLLGAYTVELFPGSDLLVDACKGGNICLLLMTVDLGMKQRGLLAVGSAM